MRWCCPNKKKTKEKQVNVQTRTIQTKATKF